MEGLNEEYNKYLVLNEEKIKLNTEVQKLIGKNDEESIRKLNELGKEISRVEKGLSLYDNEILSVVDNYFKTLKELEKINEEIKLIEKYSKKVVHNNDKKEVLSAENRKKLINKEDVERYNKLADTKRNLRKKIHAEYRKISAKTTMIKKEMITKQAPIIEKMHTGISPVFYYDSLSLDEKIEETRKRIDRIFQSTKMPNQGKKILVTFEGKKYVIPEKYKGRYHSATAELNKLLKEKNKQNVVTAKEEIAVVVPTITEKQSAEEKVFTEKEEKTNKILSIYNIDKKVSLGLKKVESRLLDGGIVIKTNGVKIARTTISKYNTTKSFVKKTSKKVAEKAVDIYKDLRKYLSVKGEIINNVKSGFKLKESMEEVYGEDKDSYIDYIIVNRTVNFNKNMCQKVNTAKGNIAKVSKKVIDAIKKPFDSLREKMYDDVERKALEEEIRKLKQETKEKKDELKRIKIKSEGGYIVVGTIIVVGIVALGAIIFTVISSILR